MFVGSTSNTQSRSNDRCCRSARHEIFSNSGNDEHLVHSKETPHDSTESECFFAFNACKSPSQSHSGVADDEPQSTHAQSPTRSSIIFGKSEGASSVQNVTATKTCMHHQEGSSICISVLIASLEEEVGLRFREPHIQNGMLGLKHVPM